MSDTNHTINKGLLRVYVLNKYYYVVYFICCKCLKMDTAVYESKPALYTGKFNEKLD
jgi:pyrroloquinoline quinone (PQQ) biosynthesis protein C